MVDLVSAFNLLQLLSRQSGILYLKDILASLQQLPPCHELAKVTDLLTTFQKASTSVVMNVHAIHSLKQFLRLFYLDRVLYDFTFSPTSHPVLFSPLTAILSHSQSLPPLSSSLVINSPLAYRTGSSHIHRFMTRRERYLSHFLSITQPTLSLEDSEKQSRDEASVCWWELAVVYGNDCVVVGSDTITQSVFWPFSQPPSSNNGKGEDERVERVRAEERGKMEELKFIQKTERYEEEEDETQKDGLETTLFELAKERDMDSETRTRIVCNVLAPRLYALIK